ncbi:MAG: nicotinate-nucleotide adenylyltransferase, partial [Emcibacter sp.]|nr:nicotinate-nucleotide adenylyltransferase [Emcibacter sp.]
IGLLGGSFDPPHAGHVHITREALKRFELDQVWWLVSPGNPLKSNGPAPLQARMKAARALMDHPRVRISDFETRVGTRHTADTLAALQAHYRSDRFVWLMGADNLVQFAAWKDWKKIAETVVFAIFDRPGYSDAALASEAATVFRDHQIPDEQAAELATRIAPAWTFIRETKNPLSSTEIRRKKL